MKKYYFLVLVFLVEVIIINVLLRMGIDLNLLSFVTRGLILFALFIPLCILLYFISKDDHIKKCFRITSKIVMWHIIICCILSSLVEIGLIVL